jgi:hypothetical protein
VATVPLLLACSASASADPEAAVPWVALQTGDGDAPPLYEAEGRIAQLLVLGDTTLLVREHRSQVAPVAISRTRRQPYAVGRFGGGPGELSYVGAIGLAAGDSLLVLPRMPSMPTNLLSIANGSGRTLVGVASTPQTARDFLSDVRFRAADSIGHIYGMRATATGDDSIAIIRKRLRDGRQETIVWLPTGEPDDARRTTNSVSVSSRGYYQMRNGWAVTGDGRVVLVDVARYAVTVLAPDAQIAASWRIARAGVPVNDSAWTAYRRRAASARASRRRRARARRRRRRLRALPEPVGGACIAAGVAVGQFLPAVPATLQRFTYAEVSIPIAVLIWLMIFPMMLQIDFGSVLGVRRQPKGLTITLVVNWLVKPFSMLFFAWLFLQVIFAPYIPAELALEYVAGAILLGAAPCTAMVFVWSYLTRGDPSYTLVQVAVNDLIMLVAFAPIVALLLGVSQVFVPYDTLLLSVVLYIVVPLVAGYLTRTTLIRAAGGRGSRPSS